MIHGPRGARHKVWDSASAHALHPLHFLVPRFGVGQDRLSRLRLGTQRVGVGMKPGDGHEGPEGGTEVQVDVHLNSNCSSGRATSQRVDPKVPRVGMESWGWTQRSKRLGTKSRGLDAKSKGRKQSPKGRG